MIENKNTKNNLHLYKQKEGQSEDRIVE